MFSANENLALRQHKRRIISYVESTIPESALDFGTTVMVMQVTCRAPGCVPLETVIAIVFPRLPSQKTPLIEGLEESKSGGTYKTKVLLPMAEVTKEDVLDALPPEFEGGRRTMERLCIQARDVTLSQITQIIGDEDVEGKKMMAEYLMECLREYVDRGCVAPEVGEAFGPRIDGEKDGTRVDQENGGEEDYRAETTEKTDRKSPSDSAAPPSAVEAARTGTGNFVMRRVLDDVDDVTDTNKPTKTLTNRLDNSVEASNSEPITPPSVKETATTNPPNAATNSKTPTQQRVPASVNRRTESAMDWRRRQTMEGSLNLPPSMNGGSQSMIQRLAQREHAPGVRRTGCPCCDPENPANVVDNMMML